MLAVVEAEPVVADRRSQAPENRAPFEEDDLCSAVRGRERSGHTGQTASDDGDADGAHGRAPARLRAATKAFSQVGSDMRPRVTAIGSALMRTSNRL